MNTSYSTVKERAAEFKREQEKLENYERSRRCKEAPTDENVQLVHSLIVCDRRRSLCDIDRQISIRFEAAQSTLTDVLGMSTVSARWAPRPKIRKRAD